MKECKYTLFPGKFDESGTLFSLLNSVPYLLMKKRLPPLVVVNDILIGGRVDAGMSGGVEWDPFTITSEEYRELAKHCECLNFEICTPRSG